MLYKRIIVVIKAWIPPNLGLPLHKNPFITPFSDEGLVLDRVALIREVQMPVGALGRQHDHANDAAGATVPLDGLRQRALDKLDGVRLLHSLSPVRVTVSVDVGRTRTANRICLLV